MTHKKEDITDVHRGQDLVQPFTIEDKDGNNKDLTGATIEFYITESSVTNPRTNSDVRLIEKTDSDDITITDESAGELDVYIDSSDWPSIPRRTGYYELWVQDSDGDWAQTVAGLFRGDKDA